MAKVNGAIVVDTEKCKGCGICIPICLPDVIRLSSIVNLKGYQYAYMEKPDECTGCTNCGIVCPDGAIKVYRVKVEN